MARSCWSFVLAALIFSLISSPAWAQDDFRSLLQAQPLTITVAELIANDTDELDPFSAVDFVIDFRPSWGTLTPNANGFEYEYQPNPQFIGVDRFRYSWLAPYGARIEGDVELLVTPWITPLAGPNGLLDPFVDPAPESVGYYNSKTGIFYFCPLPQALPLNGCLSCEAYHYPGFEPGWLPLLGSWWNADGLDLPGLYDPTSRQVYLLDVDLGCPFCDSANAIGTLRVVQQFELGSAKPRAVIPIAADLNGTGVDSVISFLPTERRFDPDRFDLSELDGSELWPLAVPSLGAPDRLAVFIPGEETSLLHVSEFRRPVELWSEASSLATARLDGSTVVYEVYDAFSHALSATQPLYDAAGIWYLDGTQLLRFPNDPDPPPHTTRTPCAEQ